MHIEKPILGEITQGTIFTAAGAENYLELPVWGLCITARCDMAHENKVRVFNYVPIVRYEDWLRYDGARILVDRIGAEIRGALKKILVDSGKSDSILDSYSPTEIYNTIFPSNKQFGELAKKMEFISLIKTQTSFTNNDLINLVKLNKRISEKTVKELWSNQLTGYYFFDHIGDTEFKSENGYVVLLREIHHIPRAVATAIAEGYLVEDAPDAIVSGIVSKNNPFDFASSVSVIKSPWIEHVLQQFSFMFSRIGLPDPQPASLQKLYKALNNVS